MHSTNSRARLKGDNCDERLPSIRAEGERESSSPAIRYGLPRWSAEERYSRSSSPTASAKKWEAQTKG